MEQIQILQGKISCLQDELSRASKEEVGENMGPIMEVINDKYHETVFRCERLHLNLFCIITLDPH